MKTKIQLVYRIILLLIGIILTYAIIKATYNFHRIDRDNLPPLKDVGSSDTLIFNDKYKSKIKPDVLYRRKDRNPISVLIFDSTYKIVVYKIDSSRITSLSRQFHFSQQKDGITADETYQVFPLRGFLVYYIYEPAKIRNEIYFTVSGNSLREGIRNDSVFYCNLFCDNFSIRYEAKGPVDFVLKDPHDDMLGPTNLIIRTSLMFLKKKQDLYFIMMTPIKEGKTMSDDLLWQLLVNNE